jgi:hypothetical protein
MRGLRGLQGGGDIGEKVRKTTSQGIIFYQLQRAVTNYDHLEQEMYNKAKGAESDRKKHDQVLHKMHEDLTYLKRANAQRLKVHWFSYMVKGQHYNKHVTCL